ncbi:hypothetical protein DACRYDRAFT_23485 [Dacryopinax primogenitus]|uniref:Uncharacterized protein n=1 Tax=Dacryopinax primogenitus (strain DJM 731) TaxID=1858805 RepID=M5FRU3_DACPD|nr:uncharacterized protein DACRYDRAFT_23485 [Dacryopinax primogenitus]EJT99950.1 hypothetical protein DACRYDRAFT_23485 [Dacryopinax primogenitus]
MRCLYSAKGDGMLVLRPSTQAGQNVIAASTTAASPPDSGELYFTHSSTNNQSILVILLAVEWKLHDPVANAAQAVFTLATTQRHWAALGIRDEVAFALLGNATELRVLGRTQDDTGVSCIKQCRRTGLRVLH